MGKVGHSHRSRNTLCASVSHCAVAAIVPCSPAAPAPAPPELALAAECGQGAHPPNATACRLCLSRSLLLHTCTQVEELSLSAQDVIRRAVGDARQAAVKGRHALLTACLGVLPWCGGGDPLRLGLPGLAWPSAAGTHCGAWRRTYDARSAAYYDVQIFNQGDAQP